MKLSTAWRAASTATGAKFFFGLHQTGLRPHAHGLVVADHFAVEQFRQGALDAFVDAREALLFSRDGGKSLFVGDGIEDDGVSLGVSPSTAASLASRATAFGSGSRLDEGVCWGERRESARGGVGRRDGRGFAAQRRLARANLLEVVAELGVLLLEQQVFLHGEAMVVLLCRCHCSVTKDYA